jgi:VCPO second helical-bundle domain
MDRSHLPAEAQELVDAQAKLTDLQKTITYYWADGPSTELPPGHWAMFAQAADRAVHLSLDATTKGFFALGNALMDASIATWKAKRDQDTVRPITYIRWLYAGKTIKGWGGPGKGTISENGANWIPYQASTVVTPPFAEYTSGHSAFSGAASQVFDNFAGGSWSFGIGLNVTIAQGSSSIEPGHAIGDAAWAKAQTYINGTAVISTTRPRLPPRPRRRPRPRPADPARATPAVLAAGGWPRRPPGQQARLAWRGCPWRSCATRRDWSRARAASSDVDSLAARRRSRRTQL